MKRWVRIFAPVGAMAVVILAGGAALGNGAAHAQPGASVIGPGAARQVAFVARPGAAQVGQPPAPTAEPQNGPDTDAVQQQDGPQTGTQNEVADAAEAPGAETADGAETPDNEAADAAALSSKATITADQASATALAANPGTTVVKAELGDENGTIVYSVELSNGADVKVDANSGAIVTTDQPGSDNEGTQDAESNQ